MADRKIPETSRDPAVVVAEGAGLRYVETDAEGIRRRRCGRGFTYLDTAGETIRDQEIRERIEELAIPPDWDEVWICGSEDGHIQATGRDSAGRKQYLYHPRWRVARDREKYRQLEALGERLPVLRRRVGRDLERDDLSRERVAGAAVRILDTLAIRVGNEEYAEENRSYGVTTLRVRHVVRKGATVRLRFPGKGGREVDTAITDPKLAGAIQALSTADGDRLFCYREDVELVPLLAADVNDYLRAVTERQISAKDFRTWKGTVTALKSLVGALESGGTEDRHAALLAAYDEAAARLGNTRQTTRDFYVHPGLAEAFESGALEGLLEDVEGDRQRWRIPGHRRHEPLLLALLPRLDDFLDPQG